MIALRQRLAQDIITTPTATPLNMLGIVGGGIAGYLIAKKYPQQTLNWYGITAGVSTGYILSKLLGG